MGITEYLQETRGELRHVAWPTRTQTIVYTVLVVAISLFIAAYLGFFDYLFTGTLSRVVNATGGTPTEVTPESASSSAPSSTPIDINSLLPASTTKR